MPAPDREEVRASPSRAGISRPPDYSESINDAVHPITGELSLADYADKTTYVQNYRFRSCIQIFAGCRSPLEIGVSKESFREPWDTVLSPDPGSPDPGG